MRLPDFLRDELKEPLGILLKDTTKENIAKHIPKSSYIITVGDATTEKILAHGFTTSLQIVDGYEKRGKRIPPQSNATKLYCDNPAAQITQQSIDLIRQAFSSKPPIQILVNGEEDLLVIPVCIYAPENSVVMYGQPNEGLVIVQITQEIRNKTKNLLDRMI
ncbi:MAG: GTP-dependent dephospho-CoA kinase family protein [Candidatus Nitrosotenuis sp.]